MDIFARILVPVDGSAPSDRAVGLAVRVAGACEGCSLIFCHVVDRARIVADIGNMALVDPTPIIEDARSEGERVLAAAATEATSRGISVRTVLCDGEPVAAIEAFAEQEGADLIVMGSHGRKGLKRLVMGSTTEGVMRRSNVPVLVIREERERARDPRPERAVSQTPLPTTA